MMDFQKPGHSFQQTEMESDVDWGGKEWGTHRHHIRQLIEHAMDLLIAKDKAMVLGAGNHGDVDLPALASQFLQLTVLDTEANAIDEVLEESAGGLAAKVKSLTNVDYTCLDQVHFYEKWEDMLIAQTPAADIAAYIKDCAFEVRKHEALPRLKKSFDLVVSSSVHTQLFYIHALTQLASYADKYSEQEIRQIIEALSYLRNSLVQDYNRLLLSLLKPDGRLVVWSDMVRLDDENRQLLDDLYALQSEKERISFLFRAFGEYGIEPAVLGLKDLHHLLSHEHQLFKCWVWIPGEGRQYIVAGFSAAAAVS